MSRGARVHRAAARAAAPLAALLLATVLVAQETRPPAPDEFVYGIPDEGITLEQLARDAEKATGRTFILTDKSPLRGKVIRLEGEARVARSEVFALFQGLFVTQGFALKPLGDSGGRILVVENIEGATDLKQRATFVTEPELDRYRNEVGTIVMTFFQLRHVRLQNVRAALAQILSSKSVETTLDVESANALLVIGFAPTVYAMKQVIRVMDVPRKEASLEFALIPLEHAVSEELEPILQDLLAANPAASAARAQPQNREGGQVASAAEAAPPARIVADPRLNAFAVYATKDDLAEVRRLVAALDLEARDTPSSLNLYWLKHTNAEDVAELLGEAYGFTQTGGRRARNAPAAGGGKEGGGGTAPRSTGPGEGIHVVPEPLNNVLIIRASRTQYAAVLPLLQELDRPRAQVVIRAVIAEMTNESLKQVGSEIAALDGGDGRYHPGLLTGFGLSALSITQVPGLGGGGGPGTGTGTGGGMGGGGVSQPGEPNLQRLPFFPGNTPGNSGGIFGLFNDKLNVPLLIKLMQTGRRGTLVSTPIVVANDNERSMIESGVQAATQTFTSSGQQGDQSSFGGYQEAKIALTISPHISNDAYVRLEVELLVERFLPPTDTRPGVPPDKTSRKLVGSVTLRDGQTALVGGLVLNQDRAGQDGVPPLADSPILGPLFRVRETSGDRAAVYVFLTPTIVDVFDVLEEVSYDKKLEVMKLQGPIRLIDPHFRPVALDHRSVVIEGIEGSGLLDLPRYVPVVPLKESDNVVK